MQEQSGTTPLLASEEEAPTSLSSHHHDHHDAEEPSGFARLMQLSNNNNNDPYYNNPLAELAARYDPYYAEDSYLLVDAAATGSTSYTKPYLVSVTAGTLCLLHAGLVLSSLVAEAWSATGMRVDLRAWPVPPQGVFIAHSSLATRLQQLHASHHAGAAVLLWGTSLVIPCTFMVLAPSWSFGTVVRRRNQSHNKRPSKWRLLLELSVRWALVVVFVEATLGLISQFVLIEWTGSSVSLQNSIGTGLACFTVGSVCAVVLTVLLRWNQFHPIQQQQESAVLHHMSEDSTSVSDSVPAPRLQTVKTPPPHAFRHRLNNSNDDDNAEEEESHRLQILEETPPVSPNRTTEEEEQEQPAAMNTPPPTAAAAAAGTDDELPPSPPQQPKKALSFLQLLLVFQVGLLSILSFVPALVLPAVTIHFSGIAAEFMPQRSHTVFLHQIPSLLLRRSGNQKATAWIGALLTVPTVMVPCLATILAVTTWVRVASAKRAAHRRWLYALHPAMGGVVAAAALLLAFAVLQDWSRYAFNDASFCDNLESSIVGEPCLTMTVQSKTGAWFLALQSVLLEVFVVLTLIWS